MGKIRRIYVKGFRKSENYAIKKRIPSLRNFSKASRTFLTEYKPSKPLLDLAPSKIKRRKKRDLVVPIGI